MKNQENEQIIQTIRTQIDGMIHKDFDLLVKVISPDATFTHINGKSQTRDEWLHQIKLGRMAYQKNVEKKVTVTQTASEDEAIVILDNLLTARIYGFENTWAIRTTTTVKKMNNDWQIIYSSSNLY